MALMDATKLETLVQALRDGDDSVKEEIILEFRGLARSLARHAVARHPRCADDIRSAAAFGLVQAVNWAQARMYNNYIGPYITTTVRRFIRDYLEQNHTIRVPRKEWMKMIERLNLEDLDDWERMRAEKTFYTAFLVISPSTDDGGSFLEESPSLAVDDKDMTTIRDICDYLRLSAYELQVVQKRMENYTFEEIAQCFGRGNKTIQDDLKRIQRRYRIIQRAHPNLPTPPPEV